MAAFYFGSRDEVKRSHDLPSESFACERARRSRSTMAETLTLTFPVVALIALGYGLARSGVITASGEASLANLVFFATTPALLFRAMASMPPPDLADLGVLLGYFAPSLALYAAWLVAARRIAGASLGVAAIGAMGVGFSNTVLLGIPIIDRAYGAPGLRLLVLIVSIHSATFFTLTTLLIESDRGRARIGATLRATAIAMAKNPILLSIAVGAAWGAAALPIPAPLDHALQLLGSATSTIALIAVGAGLAAMRLGEAIVASAAISATRLLVVPLGVWVATRHILGLEPLAVAVATISAALPVGTNVYILARRYDVGSGMAAGAVLISTLAAALTVPPVMLALR
jgi:predicted permease